MKKVKITLDEFIKQLQKIQTDMVSVKHHSGSNSISFCLHSNEYSYNLEHVNLCEDEDDPAIEYDYHMGCRCTLGVVINLMKEEKE